ncbi:uncharacterized protein LOC142356505 [Convolutriloba macropyga]|uniref:uncharacterized protein LOC142356505 n=1 Tax=Convolutriloba macropyga TaxID=536237 RepID=UPI003F526E9A
MVAANIPPTAPAAPAATQPQSGQPPSAPPAAAAPPQKLDSKVVGQHFVAQYYGVLQKSPAHLHRFFKEESTFAHQALTSTGRELVEVPAQEEALLQEKINKLYPSEAAVDVLNVDTQPSMNGGIIVQVTGALRLVSSHSAPRPFAQTFFLAVQPGGFFVLNDILRYTPEVPAPAPAVPVPAVAAGVPVAPTVKMPPPSMAAPAAPVPLAADGSAQPPAPKVQAQPAPPHYVPQGMQPPAQAAAPPPAAPPATQTPAAAPVPPAQPAAAKPALPASEPPAEEPPSTEASKPAAVVPKEEAPAPAAPEATATPAEDAVPSAPLTYAERMKLSLASKAAAAAAAPAAASAAPPPVVDAPPATTEALENGSAPAPAAVQQAVPSPAAPNSSVFIRYLPGGTEEDTLVQQFARYGPLQPSAHYPKGINLKSQGNRCYAFVDFMTPEAAAAAIEGGIIVGEKAISVEEKRPNITRSGGRGAGGGRGDRRDGGRGGGINRRDSAGRGSYGGGQRSMGGAGGGRGGDRDRQGGRGGGPGGRY